MQQIVVFIRLGLELTVAANGQDIVLDADVEVLRIHVGQVGLEDQLIRGLVDVDGRGPRCQIRLFGAMR